MSRKQYGHIHIYIRVSSVNISHFSVVSWPKPKLLFSVVYQATDGKIWEMVCTWTGQLKDLNINSLNCLSYISLNFNNENLVLDWTISWLIFCFLSSPCRNTERWDYFFSSLEEEGMRDVSTQTIYKYIFYSLNTYWLICFTFFTLAFSFPKEFLHIDSVHTWWF